jgi:hypothetical protein
MTTNRIHLHLGGSEDIHSIELLEPKSLHDVLIVLVQTGKLGDAKVEEIFISEENSDDELPSDFRFGADHRGRHFHAHRCRQIEVTFIHVDERKIQAFRPAATIGKLLHWAIEHFPVDKNGKYTLRLTSQGEPLPHASHLGSYVKGPPCTLTLYFAPATRIQG